MKKKRFIILLADGARHDVFQELLDAGEVPHLHETFVQGGTFAKATSVFPSTTGPAYMPFLTGCFPGTCNVPGIRWFDKDLYAKKRWSLKRYRSYVGFESFLMNHDMDQQPPTLFEVFPKSYTIFSTVNRGVPSAGNMTSHSRLWYWYYGHLTDRWNMVDTAALNKTLDVISRDFEFLFVVFPGIDEYSHLSDCRNPKALEAYRFMDTAVKEIRDALAKANKEEETALFIVSDHGLSETREHFGVASFLESKKIKTFYYPKIFKRNFKAASMVSGNGMLHLYFKTNGTWAGRCGADQIRQEYPGLLEELLSEPAVDLVISKDIEGWVHVESKKGKVRCREQENQITWYNISGNPLSLPGDQGTWNFRQALEGTIESPYPDSLLQVTQLFRSSRAGDLVLSAAPGYDLRKRFEYPEHKSSHGALHREHMLTPLFSSVPMARNLVRSADLYPSILSLSDKGSQVPVDGENFFLANN